MRFASRRAFRKVGRKRGFSLPLLRVSTRTCSGRYPEARRTSASCSTSRSV
jgi:hypothetical protein